MQVGDVLCGTQRVNGRGQPRNGELMHFAKTEKKIFFAAKFNHKWTFVDPKHAIAHINTKNFIKKQFPEIDLFTGMGIFLRST